MRVKQLIAGVGVLAATTWSLRAADIFVDNFEGAQLYTASHADAFADIANADFFGTTDEAGLAPAIGPFDYSNIQGAAGADPNGRFYVHNDGDSAAPVPHAGTLTLDYLGIDITNVINLEFGIFVAEDDDGVNEDWDLQDQFIVTYQVDGGGYQNLFAIQNDGGGTGANRAALEDTDFDGTGDGAVITAAFTEFTKLIGDTGSTLDLKLEWSSPAGTWADDEDLAIDNVRISGTVIPEPSVLLLGLFAILLLCIRRRR